MWRATPCRRFLSTSGVLPIADGIKQVKHCDVSCAPQTINVAIRLNVDPRKPNQSVRGSAVLPVSLGKTFRVAVFARGDQAEAAREAGADLVGDADLIEQISGGTIDFDRCLATPDMVGMVGRVARILGPRGLMPSVKSGTVATDIAAAVRNAKQGQVQFRADKGGVVHAPVAQTSFTEGDIEKNLLHFIQVVQDAKPSGAKGTYIKGAYMASTRGRSVEFDVANPPFTMKRTRQR
ncbi:Ribosomal protein [Plasmodiophora brassicae]|uniref:Ribosomal protein n=1 Tax=Plasmodiophora brassicae TaxID=37360 RepID=A0A0G4J7G1_PLABS|nr:hypothetical protein PBRA_009438 [Plasmodiophora brassicae]SPQ93139.1 unnamed protein product [Plasmodiophora brassicae]